MLNKHYLRVFACVFLFLQGTTFAATLITPEEAALPAATSDVLTRGISRGPGVKLVAPSADLGPVKAPFELKVAFEPRGGNTIDPASVKVMYLKSPFIDLTPRLQQSITETGIVFPEADVPAGEHDLKITVLDKDGRETNSVIHLVVVQ
ncbi:MAG TPA: hypothetical protein VIV27_04130 [Halioglobus sp.]